jgi:hypothetical protein
MPKDLTIITRPLTTVWFTPFKISERMSVSSRGVRFTILDDLSEVRLREPRQGWRAVA